MKKKILAVALAATMVVASAFNAFAAISSDETVITDFNTSALGNVELEGDGTVVFEFDIQGYQGEGEAWEAFSIELTNAGIGSVVAGTDASYLSVTPGNTNQWWYNDASAASVWAGDITSAWDDADLAKTIMADGHVKVTVERSGEAVSITAVATAGSDTATYTLTTTNTVGFGDSVYVQLGGEDCTISGATATVTEAETNASTGATEATEATEASSEAEKNTDTSDVANFAAVAIVVAAAAAIVVLKKRVTE